jgi:hypothetical protein
MIFPPSRLGVLPTLVGKILAVEDSLRLRALTGGGGKGSPR